MIEMIIIKSIRTKVQFSMNEVTEFDLKDSPSGTTWNVKKAVDKDVYFDHAELTILKDCIKKMDEQGEIVLDMLGLCEKIHAA